MQYLKISVLSVILIGFHFNALQAQVKGDTTSFEWTPEDMISLEEVSDPVISPDGDFAAYEVRETMMEGEKSEFITQIWVAETDGSMNRQFTYGDHSASSPGFSPDGRYLTFVSARDDKPQVYRMSLDGGEAQQVTQAENGVSSYQWSPSGDRIAYTMIEPKTEEEKQREKEKRDVNVLGENYQYSRIYVKTVSEHPLDAEATQVTTGERHVTSFDWSPNGKQLAFSYWPTPRIDDMYKADIALVPADSGEITDRVTWAGDDANPHYAPNGNYLVFTSSGPTVEPIGLSNVYRVDLESGKPELVGKSYDQNASIVGFAPGGNSLLVQEPRHTHYALYRMPMNGDAPELITPEQGVHTSFSAAKRAGKVVFVYESPSMPPQVYVSDLNSFTPRRLSNVNANIDFPEMGRTELIRWKSKDGREVEGLLTYPVGYEKGDRVPLILNVHGGPSGVYLQNFTGGGSIYALQYFAANGYAVLRPNPRGSSGYGKEFRYANYQDWGYGDYDDLMTGVDKVIDMGVAHPDSLVEMGWSYGGYMTSYIVTRTDRFKAVSMGAGLPNLISMAATTDIPTYLEAHMGGNFWEDGLEEIYEKHSAIYRVDKISTPVQILHGREDDRVPTSQGHEFHYALKERGIPTEMVLYPRTPHGPREPKLIADVSVRILDWFDKFLDW